MNVADWILARLAARPYGPAEAAGALLARLERLDHDRAPNVPKEAPYGPHDASQV